MAQSCRVGCVVAGAAGLLAACGGSPQARSATSACDAVSQVYGDYVLISAGHTVSPSRTSSDIGTLISTVTAYGRPLSSQLAQVNSAVATGAPGAVETIVMKMSATCVQLGWKNPN